MKSMHTKEHILETITQHSLVVLYFTGSRCGACEVIHQKVNAILARHPYVKGICIDGSQHPSLAAYFDVYTLPILLFYVEGKESLRLGKYLDLKDFELKIERYHQLLSSHKCATE